MTGDDGRMNPLAHTHRGMSDDGSEWMTMIEMLDERELDALLGGTAPAEELAPVAAVVTRLRERAAAEPAPPMGATLRAQLYAPPVVSLHAHRAARFALVRAAVAAAVAALALVGVGAAQNRLPSGVQDVVSSTADLVGIDVPRSDERHATDDGSDDGTSDEVPSTEGTEAPGSTELQEQGDPGYEGTTPGGANPADPGTPGDKEPATPATPPSSNPGNAGGSSDGNANNGAGTNNKNNNAGTTGQANGTGTDKKAG
jgi:hypothetical protein